MGKHLIDLNNRKHTEIFKIEIWALCTDIGACCNGLGNLNVPLWAKNSENNDETHDFLKTHKLPEMMRK